MRRLYYEVFWDNWVLTCPTLVPLALLEWAFRSDPNGFELMTKRQEQKKTEVASINSLIKWLNNVQKNCYIYISLDRIYLNNIKLGLYIYIKLLLTSYNNGWRKIKFFGALENIFCSIQDRFNHVLVTNCKNYHRESPLVHPQLCKYVKMGKFSIFPTFPISKLL
ncbi:MAG: hypothetical protein PUP92_01405 [Rhizonema sp. PD38]|nr:hypothetical protein [Rhizonema sp. PD38]